MVSVGGYMALAGWSNGRSGYLRDLRTPVGECAGLAAPLGNLARGLTPVGPHTYTVAPGRASFGDRYRPPHGIEFRETESSMPPRPKQYTGRRDSRVGCWLSPPTGLHPLCPPSPRTTALASTRATGPSATAATGRPFGATTAARNAATSTRWSSGLKSKCACARGSSRVSLAQTKKVCRFSLPMAIRCAPGPG